MLKDPCHSYLVLDALVFFKLVFFQNDSWSRRKLDKETKARQA